MIFDMDKNGGFEIWKKYFQTGNESQPFKDLEQEFKGLLDKIVGIEQMEGSFIHLPSTFLDSELKPKELLPAFLDKDDNYATVVAKTTAKAKRDNLHRGFREQGWTW